MAENKKSIIVYADWIDKFEELNDEEAGRLIKHFFRYVNDLNPEAPDRITKLCFVDIENQLKRDLKKWDTIVEDRSYNGRIGNLKRWNIDLYNDVVLEKITLKEAEKIAKHRKLSLPDKNTSPPIANVADNDTVIVTVNDNVTVNDILLEKEKKENFKKSQNQIFASELLESQQWIETVAMQNKITPAEIPKWIDDFKNKLISELDNKISKKDFASHFSRWLPGEILKTKKPIQNESGNANYQKKQFRFSTTEALKAISGNPE